MVAPCHRLVILLATCLSIPAPSTLAGSGGAPPAGADYLPVTYKVHQKSSECIYEKILRKDDHVTFGVFPIESSDDGNNLVVNMKFEGPIISYPSSEDNHPIVDERRLGRALREGSDEGWPRIKDSDVGVRYDKRIGIINQSFRVDWTHAGEDEDAVAMRDRIEMEKKEAYRSYYGQPRSSGGGGGGGDRDGRAADEAIRENIFRTITQAKVEPYEMTNIIKAPGWYRLCVSAEYHALSVRMEIRSGWEMGGVDATTGHVYTYGERDRLNAEMDLDEEVARNDADRDRLDSNTYATLDEEVRKEIENQVREMDLHPTKAQVVHLGSLVAEMKRKQDHHHDRMRNHKATARRNYDSLVRSGKLETLLYFLISVVQVYTVRRWLLSKSLLGSFQQTDVSGSKYH